MLNKLQAGLRAPVLIITALFALTGCAYFAGGSSASAVRTANTSAPVVNANLFKVHANAAVASADVPFLPDTYIVRPGETIYSISNAFGIDYLELAKFNHLSSPYHLHLGQVISFRQLEMHRLNPQDNMVIVPIHAIQPIQAPKPKLIRHVKKRRVKKKAVRHHYAHRTVKAKSAGLPWPAKGALVSVYSKQHSGIDIQGVSGEAVVAVKSGTVIYSQAHVKQYGNLIIIDHGDRLLSAYGHNQAILVRLGQTVSAGQKIATMGLGPRHKPSLYFEMRRDGKSVNPLNYLSKKS